MDDRGDALRRGPVAHVSSTAAIGSKGEKRWTNSANSAILPGNRRYRVARDNPGLGRQLVHGEQGQALAADQAQSGIEDATPHLGRRLKAKLLQQVLLAAEQPVQGDRVMAPSTPAFTVCGRY